MSSDLISESRIPLNQLAREQNVALSTCWRWCLSGVRGHILESLSVGGRKFTTREAFARFIARTNGEPISSRSNCQRGREHRAAERELAEQGLLERKPEDSVLRPQIPSLRKGKTPAKNRMR
jgi:hypothetical protein